MKVFMNQNVIFVDFALRNRREIIRHSGDHTPPIPLDCAYESSSSLTFEIRCLLFARGYFSSFRVLTYDVIWHAVFRSFAKMTRFMTSYGMQYFDLLLKMTRFGRAAIEIRSRYNLGVQKSPLMPMSHVSECLQCCKDIVTIFD